MPFPSVYKPEGGIGDFQDTSSSATATHQDFHTHTVLRIILPVIAAHDHPDVCPGTASSLPVRERVSLLSAPRTSQSDRRGLCALFASLVMILLINPPHVRLIPFGGPGDEDSGRHGVSAPDCARRTPFPPRRLECQHCGIPTTCWLPCRYRNPRPSRIRRVSDARARAARHSLKGGADGSSKKTCTSSTIVYSFSFRPALFITGVPPPPVLHLGHRNP